jgi:hypothetical protein
MRASRLVVEFSSDRIASVIGVATAGIVVGLFLPLATVRSRSPKGPPSLVHMDGLI